MTSEEPSQFEQRKRDHIRIALDPMAQSSIGTGLDQIHLIHEALPDINFDEVEWQTGFLGKKTSPLFVSSMTGGHKDSVEINRRIAKVCAERNWLMGVGSQRREQSDPKAREEWRKIREDVPGIRFIGNIGVAQIVDQPTQVIQELVDALDAVAMFVHTNPVQEVFQPEGTPQFRGGTEAIQRLCEELSVPVILKETGCGISQRTFEKLKDTGLYAVDVAGLGGTHWGLVEGGRTPEEHRLHKAARTYAGWGVTTVDSIFNGKGSGLRLWASGGVRSGLDAAKLLALGAEMVGYAKPIMQSALESEEALRERMALLEYELKVALFCTGCKSIIELQENNLWSR